jgi:hypothetical protein
MRRNWNDPGNTAREQRLGPFTEQSSGGVRDDARALGPCGLLIESAQLGAFGAAKLIARLGGNGSPERDIADRLLQEVTLRCGRIVQLLYLLGLHHVGHFTLHNWMGRIVAP